MSTPSAGDVRHSIDSPPPTLSLSISWSHLLLAVETNKSQFPRYSERSVNNNLAPTRHLTDGQ